MDACNWSQDRFNEIKDEFVKMLQMIGYKPKKVPFIPYSGFNGDNLVEKVDPAKCSWYKGWTANQVPKKKVTGYSIVDCLNNFIVPPKRLPDAHSVFLSPTFTTLRELVKLSAELSNKELSDPVIKLDLCHPISRARKSSPSNSTRRSLTRPDLVTRSVFPSRVLRRTKRSILVISSTTKRMENSSQSRPSLPWSLSKSIRVSSSLDTALLSSLVPLRLLAR